MSEFQAKSIHQGSMEATVLRCNCGSPDSHKGQVCPSAVAEPLGTIAFTHADWRVMLAHKILTLSGYRFNLWVLDKKEGK